MQSTTLHGDKRIDDSNVHGKGRMQREGKKREGGMEGWRERCREKGRERWWDG